MEPKTVLEKYNGILKSKLDDYRYRHSLAVAEKSKELALKYGEDANKAYLAGLLHDITKNVSKEEHLNIFNTFGIMLNDVERNAAKLWHAMSGAEYVKGVLLIEDAGVYDAIRYHTTAKAGMPLLSKIVYLADFTSDDRDYDDVEVMRNLVNQSIEEAMEYALSYTINELIDNGFAVHLDTVSAYNEIALKGSKI